MDAVFIANPPAAIANGVAQAVPLDPAKLGAPLPAPAVAVAAPIPVPAKVKRRYGAGYMTDWWLINAAGEKVVGINKACFGGARWSEGVKGFEYLCYVNPALKEEHVRFWLRFLNHLFSAGDLQWSAEVILNSDEIEGRPINVRYRIEGPLSSHSPKNLLYATAFRYVDEIPQVVLSMYKQRTEAEDPNGMMLLFQKISADGYNGGGHAMWSSYSGHGEASSKTPIQLARFHDHLRTDKPRNVNAYFR